MSSHGAIPNFDIVVRRNVRSARRAMKRFGPHDSSVNPKALHDFRVALRRIRSAFSCYDKDHAVLSKNIKTSLKEIAAVTNKSRDLDVTRQWILENTSQLSTSKSSAIALITNQLRAQRHIESSKIRKITKAKAGKVFVRIKDKIKMVKHPQVISNSRFAKKLDHHWQKLVLEVQHFHRISKVKNTSKNSSRSKHFLREDSLVASAVLKQRLARLHQIRLAAKRLRYMLEPIRPKTLIASLGKQLKEFQDILGTLNDRAVMIDLILELSIQNSGNQRQDLSLKKQLPNLLSNAMAQRDALLSKITPSWLDAQLTAMENNMLKLKEALLA